MYESFFGFTGDPFRLTPDYRFCFRHRSFRKAKAYMEYGVQRAEGFVMVTGRPGTGKTTLIYDLLADLRKHRLRVIQLNSTQLEGSELIRMIAFKLSLQGDNLDKASLLRQIIRSLDQDYRSKRRAILVVDEAQGLSESALEELRFLTNLEKEGQSLLQVFLVGQEPLREMVRQPVMEQLHQRMIAACHLAPLNGQETEAYICHRLERVGWQGDPSFESALLAMIYRLSGGIPRRINQVLSRLLMYGFVEEKRNFQLADMRAVIEDLRDEMLLSADIKDVDKLLEELPEAPEERRSGWDEPSDDELFVRGDTPEEDRSTRREPVIGALPDPAVDSDWTPVSRSTALHDSRGAWQPQGFEPGGPEPELEPDIRVTASQRVFVHELRSDPDQRIIPDERNRKAGAIDLGRFPRRKGLLLFGVVGFLLLATILVFAGSQLHLSFPEGGGAEMSASVLGFGEQVQSKRDFVVNRAAMRDKSANGRSVVGPDPAVN
ncbi:ExeA family protein [Nitrococcus mobilis]|uniref:ATPase n=1 Tax=Nitrococcus mobilis Nb-231 TaxID=314278 RepID=A4BSL1_9GAMM|nr:AAA family ATPase [Nitrococcus mobilis]EAR21281.1 ATPase [Nitrococcus mobilis Nb-231]